MKNRNICRKLTAGMAVLAVSLNAFPMAAFAVDEDASFSDVDINAFSDVDTSKKCGDNLTWDLTGGTLTISGTGEMYELYNRGNHTSRFCAPWINYTEQITNIVINEGVTSIGSYAFTLCGNLTSVSLPNSMESIGFGAFADCGKLEEITIPNGIIGESAFIRCLSLKRVNIGAGVRNIGVSAFESCNVIEAVNITDMAAWCNIKFDGILANPLHNLNPNCDRHLYLNGNLVTELVIPEGIKAISDYAFILSSDITSVSIPASVESIGDYAFFGNGKLSTVSIAGNSLKSIGNNSFQGCCVEKINFPSSVEYVGAYAFAFNPLGSVNISNGRIENHAFTGCGFLCNLVLGNGVSYIGEYAFENCAAISEIELGHFVSYIGDNAFSGCTLLPSRGYIEYGGSKDTFAKIKIGSGNECLTGAKKIMYDEVSTSMAPVPSEKQIVTFGSYEQDNNLDNGAEPIAWYVLDVQGDKALLVSRDVLDFQRYYESIAHYNITWDESDLRTWLNDEFYNTAFNAEQKGQIFSTALTNESNPVYGTDGGAASTDNVFILSATQANTYFPYDSDRKSHATAFARTRNTDPALYDVTHDASYWWLRTPGMFMYSTMYTHYTGGTVTEGMASANFIGGVRPAMWVNKDAVAAQENKVSGFVDRLYTILLNRNAEPDGLADWTNRLTSGKATSAEIVYGIAASPEFGNKGLSNADIVERMYQAMLGRPSDQGGKADWVNRLESGMSVNAIVNGFSGSQEFANICAEYGIQAGSIEASEPRDENFGLTSFTSRMYTKALGRSYDVAGLNDWTNRYLTGTATISDIAYGFIFSPEFVNKNLSNSDYVDTLYRTFFNREPDDGGKSDWMSKLAGGMSREDVLSGFVGSQECANLVASFGIG